MRRRLALWCALFLGILGMTGIGFTTTIPAYASQACASGQHTVNLVANGTWFWNNWNGTAVNGNHINYNDVSGDGYNDWCKIQVGTVNGSNCTTNCWPFASGSGLNTRYNGRPVYKFTWEHAQSFAAEWGQYDQGVHNGRAIIESNVDDRLLEIVQSASSYWAPVWANDLEFAMNGTGNLPVLLGTQNNNPLSQGGGLWMNPSTVSQVQFTIVDPAILCQIHC